LYSEIKGGMSIGPPHSGFVYGDLDYTC
jgi:hypothetical protein